MFTLSHIWPVGAPSNWLLCPFFFKKRYTLFFTQGRVQPQSPTTTNYAVEFPTFGGITGVSAFEVQRMCWEDHLLNHGISPGEYNVFLKNMFILYMKSNIRHYLEVMFSLTNTKQDF